MLVRAAQVTVGTAASTGAAAVEEWLAVNRSRISCCSLEATVIDSGCCWLLLLLLLVAVIDLVSVEMVLDSSLVVDDTVDSSCLSCGILDIADDVSCEVLLSGAEDDES